MFKSGCFITLFKPYGLPGCIFGNENHVFFGELHTTILKFLH